MMRLFTRFSVLVTALLFAAPCFANTYTAASCSQSDVQAAINLASNGDKVIIPTTGSPCTWTSGITISGVGIDITGTGTPNVGGGTFGAGTPSTTLIDDASAPFFAFTNLSYGQTAEVELLVMTAAATGVNSILPGAISFEGTCTTSGCAQLRVDNINFTAGTWGTPLGGAYVVTGNMFGVVDHITVYETQPFPGGGAGPALVDVSNSAWQGVGAYGDNSFATADTMGTAQTLYIENNVSTAIRLSDNDVGPVNGTVGGARWACRFNEVYNMNGSGVCTAHGTAWGGRFRGQRQLEGYYNTTTCSVGNSCNVAFGDSGGSGYFFSNTIYGQTGFGFNAAVALTEFRTEGSGQSPWNNCDGTQPWDQVPWNSSSLCLDQPGTGQGLLLQSSTPVLASAPSTPCTTAGQCWTQAALDPVYESGDTGTNLNSAVYSSDPRMIYYAEVSQSAQSSSTSPFNGTTGTGFGTLAHRPTTCTTGVGYWATDQGSWNTYNSSQEGELYICTSTNTWTMSYEPYTYPDPLDGGTPTAAPPAPATNLFAQTTEERNEENIGSDPVLSGFLGTSTPRANAFRRVNVVSFAH